MAEWVGLTPLAGDAGLRFVAFVGFVLITVLGTAFARDAYRNGVATHLDAQVILWGYLLLAGVAAAVYGLLGVLRVVFVAVADPLSDLAGGAMLVMVLCLALALRAVYRTTGPASRPTRPAPADRPVVALFVGLLAVSTLGTLLPGGPRTTFLALQGVAGCVFVAYGYRFWRRQFEAVGGTPLDGLLRHLLPVLVFGSLIPIAQLAVVIVDRAVVLQVQVVLVVVTATSLMTATIELRQHLARLR